MEYKFIDFLQQHITISPDEITQLQGLANKVELRKGDYILKEGQKCTDFFFVESGLLKQYSIDKNNKEHIIHFAAENWFIGDRESIFFNAPSIYNIQCLENTTLFVLNAKFEAIMKDNTSYSNFLTKLLHNHVRHLQKRINQLLSATAEERYLDFTTTYPNIMQRVPQIMVAAYLGIAPESLSRVRKELASK